MLKEKSRAEANVRLSARMYEIREFMRTALGKRYEGDVGEAMALIRARAMKDSMTEMKAGIDLAKECDRRGKKRCIGLLTAAMVELCEPETGKGS